MSRGISKRQRLVLDALAERDSITIRELADLIYPETKPYRDYFKGLSFRKLVARHEAGISAPGEPMEPGNPKWWSLQRMMQNLEKRRLVGRSRWKPFIGWCLPEKVHPFLRDVQERQWASYDRKLELKEKRLTLTIKRSMRKWFERRLKAFKVHRFLYEYKEDNPYWAKHLSGLHTPFEIVFRCPIILHGLSGLPKIRRFHPFKAVNVVLVRTPPRVKSQITTDRCYVIKCVKCRKRPITYYLA